MQQNESAGDFILVLTGLHPGKHHCDLLMCDFNQEFVIARVMKPAKLPGKGMLVPVLTRLQHLPQDILARIQRRMQCEQPTDFVLDGCRFTGRIAEVTFHREKSLCEESHDVEVATILISCA